MSGRAGKRDLVTCATLTIVFFLIASWNLGNTMAPTTVWQATQGSSFYLDLGSTTRIDSVHILVKEGEVNFSLYSGRPDNWTSLANASYQDYFCWKSISINIETQYVRFSFSRSYGEIAELAISNKDLKLPISQISDEHGENPTLVHLIDEQEKVVLPITYMSKTYFDEIYYVRTAEEYLNHEYPFEWTHPPLGKIIILTGISIFGYSPFGWRIMGVVFASLMIPGIYLLGKKMFGTWIGAFVPAFLLMFDFMHFTMSRMATVDTFAIFFSIWSNLFFFAYLKGVISNGWGTSTRPLLLSVLFFALGFATKWYLLYGFAGQMILLAAIRTRDLIQSDANRRVKIRGFFAHPFMTLLGFIGIAVAIYFLIYIPDMIAGRSLWDIWNLQWSMYGYHSTLVAEHPFSSQWWSWPFSVRPVWLEVSTLPGGLRSTIAAMGNPAVWWAGFVSILMLIEEAIRKRTDISIFILVMFFSQWLVYAPISRVLFLYHFYINVTFLCLSLSYFINKSWEKRMGKMLSLSFLIAVVTLFVIFYPVVSGFPVLDQWIEQLRWISSWIF